MEVHRQTCQLCGSHEQRNLLVRESGEPDKVFVECAKCHELVARYIVSPGGYFHAHRGYESFLRGVARSGEVMSGKKLTEEFEEMQGQVEARFERIKIILAEKHKVD
ncbi:MAG: hypothetical protein A2508_08635 [Candidatus Lambdaproteobacteria bacterium RIFOXYD12_FULL_49_8]|uniref:Uncharacterized protein n=1 Tax=Candidatus Lambdaproteobacteria bacterium RIFOXYD2_FULL_50_16 TaxID=1817772 RepID=A0A1F6GAD4_9PROT|nr:MAG: hypothetical protein A2527_07830 [Candidatus Lambdaproteobacteria bacterium RIFOXYD2_FULL_50_16]OGG98003.1 MAG: hypothetical protein A2508_08635 [Candidatus Lambdaproteobacteria bacterium RIFOXYD12_FULL_49_8]